MRLEWYRQRKGKLVAGVLSSLADQMSWNVFYVRLAFVVIALFAHVGLLALAAYVLLAVLLPYKEDVYAERFGTGPRKRKDAEKIEKDWFW